MTDVPTVPGLTADEHATLARLLRQLDDRQSGNRIRSAYYDGRRAAGILGQTNFPQYRALGIVLGWSAVAVDKMARRCNLDGFVWPDGDLTSIGADVVWESNYLGAEVSGAITSSLIHGPAFLVTTRGGAGEPPALIHTRDALSSTGTWNARSRRLDDFLSVAERDEYGALKAFTLYVPDLTISAVKDAGTWHVDRSIHALGVPVEPLVYKPRPGRPWGESRISRNVMSVHDRGLRTLLRLEGHSDIFSMPQMLLLGASGDVFRNADGSAKPAWQVALGRVFALDDDMEKADTAPALARASVQMFQASSPQPHLDTLRQAAQEFAGLTSVPLTSLGISDQSNPTSADSYVASREDLIAEAEGATDDWAPALRRTMLRALAIANGLDAVPESWRTIDAKWRSPMYLSRAAQADAGLKQLTAAPWLAETEVGLELLGLNEQQIRRAMAEKRRAAGRGVLQALRERGGAPASPIEDPGEL